MSRHIVGICTLSASLLMGASAHAEEAELQSRFLVTAQVYASMQTGVDNPLPGSSDTEGFVYPSANTGLRLGLGRGQWSKSPRVYLGHMADGGDFVEGFTVGVWARTGSPSPSLSERSESAYGLSYTHYDQTEQGRLLSTTVEGGVRVGIGADGELSTVNDVPLMQGMAAISTQALLMNNVLLGPLLELRVGNKYAPWSTQVGLRVSI